MDLDGETPTTMPRLVSLPPEIVHHIVQWLTPAELVELPLVCRALSGFVRGNSKLHQDVYLNYLVRRRLTTVHCPLPTAHCSLLSIVAHVNRGWDLGTG